MNINRFSVFVLLIIMVFIMPVSASAKVGMKINPNGFASSVVIDSIPKKQPAKKDDNKTEDQKQDAKIIAKKPDIKEVPKAKRKLKPAAVKTKIKIPVKRVKPVIKKPVRLIRKNLGI